MKISFISKDNTDSIRANEEFRKQWVGRTYRSLVGKSCVNGDKLTDKDNIFCVNEADIDKNKFTTSKLFGSNGFSYEPEDLLDDTKYKYLGNVLTDDLRNYYDN